MNGIYINENLDTEPLARDRVYEFAWSFNPLPLKGATGSPGQLRRDRLTPSGRPSVARATSSGHRERPARWRGAGRLRVTLVKLETRGRRLRARSRPCGTTRRRCGSCASCSTTGLASASSSPG
jgi:hypothetical protein